MKEIIVLFGEMGGGKNYWGEKIAQDKGYLFYDGDDAVSFVPEMAERVAKFKPLSKQLVRKFVDNLVVEVSERARVSPTGVVVAQALYSNADRLYFAFCLVTMGYRVTFKWVKPPFWQNLKQIYSRPNGFRWVLYWLMNKPFFEDPNHEHDQI